ncbi:hypothetical protein KRMM14A1259_46980 [Krasilnikovia sp. MM14-A1259]
MCGRLTGRQWLVGAGLLVKRGKFGDGYTYAGALRRTGGGAGGHVWCAGRDYGTGVGGGIGSAAGGG